jgi:hypothetical protein
MSLVIDREFIETVGELLREYVRMQNVLLSEMLHEHKAAQLDVLERALGAHLKAQGDMVDRLLGKMEALFRAPASEPETTGRQRLDS